MEYIFHCGLFIYFLAAQKVRSMVLTECETYSRVCGYLRPIANWNDSKQAEFHDRKMFDSITPDLYEPKL